MSGGAPSGAVGIPLDAALAGVKRVKRKGVPGGLFFCIGCGMMNDDQKRMSEQAEWILQVLNQQRHDWLNHVQVLLSYLKLGRIKQAEEYLKRVTELTFQEGMIARIQFPQLAVFLLTFNALNNRLRLEVEIDGPLNFSTIEMDHQGAYHFVTELVYALQSHLDLDATETASLLISLTQIPDAVVFRFDLEGVLFASGEAIVAKMVEQRNQQSGAKVTEWIQNGSEWVLEVQFPCRT